MMTYQERMYHDFRSTIDGFAFPLMKKWAEKEGAFVRIESDGHCIGFLMIISGYVEAIYVEPAFRRHGLARKAVLDYIDNGGSILNLHIVRGNKVAERFWRSIFNLEVDMESPVDILYRVKSVKKKYRS